MSRHIIILQEKSLKLEAYDLYMQIRQNSTTRIIGYRHIESMYIFESIPIPLYTITKIATKIPLYIIDRHGYIKLYISKLQEQDDETA